MNNYFENTKNMEFVSFDIQDDSLNGLKLNGVYIPEDVIINILKYLEPRDVLKCSLVCKRWCNYVKSSVLWQHIYNLREYPKKAKCLPWYVFYCYFTTDYFKNLIKNGNGENQFQHWIVQQNGGDHFVVQDNPGGCGPLPVGIPEFHGHTSCFATSFGLCKKFQKVEIPKNSLICNIIEKYKPHLYASEWYCGRFDCASYYKLTVAAIDINEVKKSYKPNLERAKFKEGTILQWSNPQWQKVEIVWTDYPSNISGFLFIHEGKDLQFWAGHYGSKFTGGVMKFLFETIESITN